MTAGKPIALLPKFILPTPLRLFAIYVSLFCAAVAAAFIYVTLAMQAQLTNEAQAGVQSDLDAILRQYAEGGRSGLIQAVSSRSAVISSSLYLLTDDEGKWLAGNLDVVSEGLWNTVGITEFGYRQREAKGGRAREALGIVNRLSGNLRLIVARDIENHGAMNRVLRRALFLGWWLIIVTGVIAGLIFSRSLLRRVDAASNAAHAIMQGNMSERIPMTGRNDEFERLSGNLNAMLDRIQGLMTGLKEVSDNIAHDLKTPLHRLRTRAERALRSNQTPEKLAEALGSVIEEADTLIHTFDALLNIARLEAGSRAESFGPLNICALVRDVVELYEPAAEENGLHLDLACTGDLRIFGEKHLIGQALANLLDNAIKYASPSACDAPHSAARVSVRLEDHGESVQIVVADQGPGIEAKDRERVLQRFVRLQPSRSIPGSGLGLSLVGAVAHLHQGSVTLEDGKPGLRVRLTLRTGAVRAPQTAMASRPLAYADGQ